MMLKQRRAFALRLLAQSFTAGALATTLIACGGAQTPPPEDPPLQDDSSDDEQAPSSDAVKRATDAIKAEKFAEAAAILAEELKKSPDDPQANFFYGVALERTDKPEEAAASYKKAIQLEPKLLEASQNLSALLLDLEDNRGALDVANAGLEVAPKDPGLLINRAYALDLLAEKGKPNPEAVKAYEAALAAAPDNVNVNYYYAGALAANGEKDKAIEQLGKLPLDSKDLPLVDIVTIYSQLGAFKECTAALTKQVEKARTVELLVHRSSCKSEAKDAKGAEADLRDAVATDPNSSVAHFYLARFLDKSGKKAEAKKHLDKANELKKAGVEK